MPEPLHANSNNLELQILSPKEPHGQNGLGFRVSLRKFKKETNMTKRSSALVVFRGLACPRPTGPALCSLPPGQAWRGGFGCLEFYLKVLSQRVHI